MISEELVKLFDSYINELLEENEKSLFEEQLINDLKLREDYETYLKTVNSIKLEAFREESRKIHNDIKKKDSLRKNLLFLFLLVLLASSIMYFLKPSPAEKSNDNLFASNYEPYPNIYSFRSSQAEISKALEAYSLGKYAKATRLFNGISLKNDDINFYHGMTLLANDEFDRGQFKLLMNAINIESKFYQQSQWYLGLSHLKPPAQPDSTILYLSRIQPNQFKFTEAQNIIGYLKD